MNEFSFEYEQSAWELTLEKLHYGETISAVRFLTLMEGEEEYAWEEALQVLEDKHIALLTEDLPKDYGGLSKADLCKRLCFQSHGQPHLRLTASAQTGGMCLDFCTNAIEECFGQVL